MSAYLPRVSLTLSSCVPIQLCIHVFIDLLSLLILVRLLLSFPCQVNPRKIALFMCSGKYMEVCMIHLSFFLFLLFTFFIYFFSEFHEEIHITFSSSSSLSFGVSFFLKLLFILFSTQNFYSNFLSMCNFLRKILPFFHEHNRVVYAWKFQFTFLFDFLALIH